MSFDTRLPRDLRGFFTISLTGNHAFHAQVAECTSKRSGQKLMVRDFTGPAVVHLSPAGVRNFPAHTTAYVSFTIIGRTRADDIVMQLPAFDVSNLSTFPLATLVEHEGTMRIQVADQSVDEPLSPVAAGVRSALRSSIGVDSLPPGRRRDITVIFDVSASMRWVVDDRLCEAMAAFAAGIVSVAAQGRRMTVATSQSPAVAVDAGPDAVTSFAAQAPDYASAGWGIDATDIHPGDAVLVLSDDVPAALRQYPGTVHVLTPVPPAPGSPGTTYTLFTPELAEHVLAGDIVAMAPAAQHTLSALAGKD
ncbi:hypothetical protein C1Y63_10685 [Corynebacterium sp. 13CS0277]|nr:hypothetical protein C1Y63_10685 [Corynebacterium sp. 13CS0277]